MTARAMRYREIATVLDGLPVVVDVALRMFGISQRELARRAGVSSASVSRLMSNRDITLATAVAILRALDGLVAAVPADAVDADQET